MKSNGLPQKKRNAVLIGTHDLNFGIKLADWLAAHSYQAVLIRSWSTMLEECRQLRPQAIVMDDAQATQPAALCLAHLVPNIGAISPGTLVVAIGEGVCAAPAPVAETSSLRLIRVRSADFAHIGRLIHAELSCHGASPPALLPTVAPAHQDAASPPLLSLPTDTTDGWMVCHRCQGLMHRVDPLDPLDALRPSEREAMQAWRCISCGNLIDPVIMRNRHLITKARSRRRSSSPRQPVYKGLTS